MCISAAALSTRWVVLICLRKLEHQHCCEQVTSKAPRPSHAKMCAARETVHFHEVNLRCTAQSGDLQIMRPEADNRSDSAQQQITNPRGWTCRRRPGRPCRRRPRAARAGSRPRGCRGRRRGRGAEALSAWRSGPADGSAGCARKSRRVWRARHRRHRPRYFALAWPGGPLRAYVMIGMYVRIPRAHRARNSQSEHLGGSCRVGASGGSAWRTPASQARALVYDENRRQARRTAGFSSKICSYQYVGPASLRVMLQG